MKKYSLLIFIALVTIKINADEISRHVILPRQFLLGQEFIYEGIPYVIKGFNQEKGDEYENVTLFLEYPISFGLEFGKENLVLNIRQGKDKHGNKINTHIPERSRTLHWKTYFLAFCLIKYFFPSVIIGC